MEGDKATGRNPRTWIWQNGLFHSLGNSSSSLSSTASTASLSTAQVIPATSPVNGPNTGATPRQKLSTRFQSAQKLNNKLTALTNVRRSKTFNVSDVHEELLQLANGQANGMTLPKQNGKKTQISAGNFKPVNPLDETTAKPVDPTETDGLRVEIGVEALNEIKAFESFISEFATKASHSGSDICPANKRNCYTSSPKSSTSSSSGSKFNELETYYSRAPSYSSRTLSTTDLKTKRLLATSNRIVRTLERQKKIIVSPQASEDAAALP